MRLKSTVFDQSILVEPGGSSGSGSGCGSGSGYRASGSGAGSGSGRAIAGTLDLHLEAERLCAQFKEVEATLIYSAGYTANVGLIPTLVRGPEDVIISDELNISSQFLSK